MTGTADKKHRKRLGTGDNGAFADGIVYPTLGNRDARFASLGFRVRDESNGVWLESRAATVFARRRRFS